MRWWRLVVLSGAIALGAGACGGDDSTEATGATTPTATAATVELRDSPLGEIVVDDAGMTLYVFTRDSDGTSACVDACVDQWPPLTADGDPSAGEGLDEAQLGTITRDDGSDQVTYAGAPLYRFAGDDRAGDTNGQAAGGVWFVVGADGTPIEAAPAAAEPGY